MEPQPTPSHGALTFAPLSAHVHRVGMHSISNRDIHFVPAAQQLSSSSDDKNRNAVECRKVGVHYETPYFHPRFTLLE